MERGKHIKCLEIVPYIGLFGHGGEVGTALASQQEGSTFASRHGAFFCGVYKFSLCMRGFCPGTCDEPTTSPECPPHLAQWLLGIETSFPWLGKEKLVKKRMAESDGTKATKDAVVQSLMLAV